jgi:hypothetical protein
MLLMAYRAGMISREQVMTAFGMDKDVILEEPTYEERRSRLLDMCEMEGTDMQLHNAIVVELLQYMSGDENHSCEFGNVVGEIYQLIEKTGMTVEAATFHLMCQSGTM